MVDIINNKPNITYGFLLAWDISNSLISKYNIAPFSCGGILIGLNKTKSLNLPFNINFVWGDTGGNSEKYVDTVIKLIEIYKVNLIIGTEYADPTIIGLLTNVYNIPFLPVDTSDIIDIESDDYIIYRLWSLYSNYANILPLVFEYYKWKHVNILYSEIVPVVIQTAQAIANNFNKKNIKIHSFSSYIPNSSLVNNGVRIFIIPMEGTKVTQLLYEAISKNMIDGYVYILLSTRDYVAENFITDPILIKASKKSFIYISNNVSYDSKLLSEFKENLPEQQENFYNNYVPPINGTIDINHIEPINLTNYKNDTFLTIQSPYILTHTVDIHDSILFSANLHKIAYEKNSTNFLSIDSWNKYGKDVIFDGILGKNIKLKNNTNSIDNNAIILSNNSISDVYYNAYNSKIIDNIPLVWGSGSTSPPVDYIVNTTIPFWIYIMYGILTISIILSFFIGRYFPSKFKKYKSVPPIDINFYSIETKDLSNKSNESINPIINNNNIITFNDKLDINYPNSFKGKWGNIDAVFKKIECRQIILEKELIPYMNVSTINKRILPYIGIIYINDIIFVATQYMSNGSLDKYLIKFPNFSFYERVRLIYQMLEGLNYLHNNNIIHGDIACRNLLLSSNLEILICDFGMSIYKNSNKYNHNSKDTDLITNENENENIIGPIRWMAPEIISQKELSSKNSDIYSCGITMYEILTGNIPWKDRSDTEVLNEILVKKKHINLDEIKQSMRYIIEMCLNYNPKKRIKLSELLKFVKKICK
jgi:hypothetical protein